MEMAANFKHALRVATFNTRGLSARRRQYQLNRILLENDIDLLAVQETKIESEELTDRMVEVFRNRYNVCVSHAIGRAGGCAIFIRKSLGIIESVFSCDNGRLVFCDFLYAEIPWRVVCVYAPNRTFEREIFFSTMRPCLECERSVLLLGDFNYVCRPEDRSNSKTYSDKSADLLHQMIVDNELEDIALVLTHEDQVKYTHFQNASHARLDRIYVPFELVSLCSQYDTQHVSFSDHSLVIITIGTKKKSVKV